MQNLLQRHLSRWRPTAALLLASLAIAGILVLLTAPRQGQGAGTQPGGAGPQPTATTRVNTIMSDYATYYQNLHQLKADADLVVLGTVTGVKGATSGTRYGVVTTYAVRAEAVLGGKQQASIATGQTVFIEQIGGSVPGYQTINDNEPLMTVGERCFLFLRYVPDGVLGIAYNTLGGPQGRFQSSGGMVHGVHSTPMIPDAGMSEANFRAAIARA